MRLLVTNDDGIYSPGLHALGRIAERFGEVRVVAPDVEQSSRSHAITSSRPLRYRPVDLPGLDAYRVDGTPADCVALGLHQWEEVDVVLSGINHGPNLGNAIWHSGTLAAAKQAVLLGTRGIALSTPGVNGTFHFDELAAHVEEVLDHLLHLPDAPALCNVNFPPHPTGMRWTRQAVRHYDGEVVPDTDPKGRELFWFTVSPIEEVDEGTDLWAIRHGYTSVTPLRLDLTHHGALEEAAVEAETA